MLAAFALVEVLSAARDVVILLGVALFLAVALNPAVVLLQRWLPRGLAVASVFIGLLVMIGLFVVALAVPIINQTDNLQKAAPGYVDKLKKDPTLNDLNKRYHLVSKASAAAGKLPEKVFGAADKVVTGVAETITAIFLTLFLMLELPTLSAGVLSLMPAEARRAREHGWPLDVNRQVGGYVIGNLAISVIAGLVTGISLWILGVPYAAALGILMGVFDLVPLIGATIGAIAAIGVAFAAQGPTAGIIMLVINIVYQQVENHVLQPIVYRKTVQLSAFLVLVAVLLGGALLGVLGALVAIPVAGSIQVIARDLLADRRRPSPLDRRRRRHPNPASRDGFLQELPGAGTRGARRWRRFRPPDGSQTGRASCVCDRYTSPVALTAARIAALRRFSSVLVVHAVGVVAEVDRRERHRGEQLPPGRGVDPALHSRASRMCSPITSARPSAP